MTTATELTKESVEQDSTILIVSTDKLWQTGTCTWSFMFSENQDGSYVVPDDIQNVACDLPFAHMWTSHDDLRKPKERNRTFNDDEVAALMAKHKPEEAKA